MSFCFLLFPSIGLAEKVVVIDPGHGGKHTGTCGYSGNQTRYCEKHSTLEIALKLRDQLKGLGIKVYLTRTTDKDFASYIKGPGGDLENRMKIANDFVKGNNDQSLFLTIHHNGHPRSIHVRGLETYFYNGIDHAKPEWPHDPLQIKYLTDSKRFAQEVHTQSLNRLKLIDRGIHDDQSFYMIRNAQMPSVLVELGYMTNPTEEALIKSSTFKTNAAIALATAIKNYFKVFEVIDESGSKIATYKSKEEAINFARSQNELVKVFDKDKQQFIYNNSKYAVYHRTNGYLGEFVSKEEAIEFATSKANSRVVLKERDWTVWSNYLEKNYYVYVNNVLYNTFFDYEESLEYAKKEVVLR